MCSISITYPFHETSTCGLPAAHRFSPWFKREREIKSGRTGGIQSLVVRSEGMRPFHIPWQHFTTKFTRQPGVSDSIILSHLVHPRNAAPSRLESRATKGKPPAFESGGSLSSHRAYVSRGGSLLSAKVEVSRADLNSLVRWGRIQHQPGNHESITCRIVPTTC